MIIKDKENKEEKENKYFKRATGVSRKTFELMRKILTNAEEKQKSQGGRPNTLSIINRLFMFLMYYREYRTFFAIADTFGVTESTCYRNCIWVESILIKHCKRNSLNSSH